MFHCMETSPCCDVLRELSNSCRFWFPHFRFCARKSLPNLPGSHGDLQFEDHKLPARGWSRMARLMSSVVFLLGLIASIAGAVILPGEYPEDQTALVQEPNEHYYIVKNKQVQIVCQARNAEAIIFTCMGTQIPESSVELDDVSEVDPGLIQAKIDVTRADVQNLKGGSLFWCTCSALDVDDQVVVTSRRGYVSIAYLKSKFAIQPSNATVVVGENVELMCGAPEGQPKPEVVWKKGDKKLDLDNNPKIIVTDLGNLVIKSATTQDSGPYQCIARNIASRRESNTAYVVVTALEESAEPRVMLSGDNGTTNKTTAEVVKPRTARQLSKTHFIVEPQARSYITADKALLLDCAVVAADILTFSCNNKRVAREQQTVNQGLDSAGNRNIQSQLKVNYADVEAFQTEFGDSQTYQCICSAWFQDSANPSGWGRLDSNSSLGHIVLAYLESVFQSDPSDVTTALGTDATLTCNAPKGQPTPLVHWYKDGSRLEARSKFISDSKGHLVIRNVQSEDAGQYSCLAQNSVKSVQSRVSRLTVTAVGPGTSVAAHESEDNVPDFPEVVPKTPVFLRDFQPEYTVSQGGALPLVCAVMSAEQITLECGGKRLAPQEYELQSKIHRETGKRLLYVKTSVSEEKVTGDDFYCQCTAWYLNEQKAWEKVAGTKGNIQVAKTTTYIGDHFVVNPRDNEAFLESDLEFDCKPPEGNPSPSVHWLKDGVQIDTYTDSNFVVLNDGKLIIEYVRSTDEGVYICVANNEAGTRFSQAAKLIVIDKHETSPTEVIWPETTAPSTESVATPDSVYTLTEPIFSLEPITENYIIQDTPINLTCSVIAAKSLLFVCNGEVLRESALTAVHNTHSEMHSPIHENFLVVTKDKVEAHTGPQPYTCTCRAYYQKEGQDPRQLEYIDSSSAVIEVAYLQNRFQQEPTDTKVANLGQAELTCKPPSGNPKPEVRWLKDGYRLSPSERIQVKDGGNLLIKQFSTDDVGTYTCVAENLVRQRTSQTARVTLADESSDNVTTPDSEHRYTSLKPETETSTVKSIDTQYYERPTHFTKDLDPVYDLIENRPVTLVCGATDVEIVKLICGRQEVEDLVIKERMQTVQLPTRQLKMVKVIEASKNMSRSDLPIYQPGIEYYCQCQAFYFIPEERKVSSIESRKAVIRIEKNEVDDCVHALDSCSKQLQHNDPDKEFCVAVPEYIACVEYHLENERCAEVLSKDSTQAIIMAKDDAQARCSFMSLCPEVESCQRSHPPFNDLSVKDFCLDSNNRVHCTAKAVSGCNVTLSPVAQKDKDQVTNVVKWFNSYCHTLFQVSQSMEFCDEIEACDKYISPLTTENTTSWCKYISPLLECTKNTVDSCSLDEQRQNLQDLYSQSVTIACSDELEPGPKSEIGPDGEDEAVLIGETKSENTQDGEDDDDSGGRKEESAAAAKESGYNGTFLQHAPTLLATILPLLVMVNISMR